MSSRPVGGSVCAAKGCKNNFRKCNKVSFFRFPLDPERARVWAEESSRPDLMELPIETLHQSHRICGAHFEDEMFLNDLRNRLYPHAVPLLFEEPPSNYTSDHSYSCRACYLNPKESPQEPPLLRGSKRKRRARKKVNGTTDNIKSRSLRVRKDLNSCVEEITIIMSPPSTDSLSSTESVESSSTSSSKVKKNTNRGMKSSKSNSNKLVKQMRTKMKQLQSENLRLKRKIELLEEQQNSKIGTDDIPIKPRIEHYGEMSIQLCKS